MSELTREGVETLYSMLSTMRPHESKSEKAFVEKFLDPLDVAKDDFGNVYKIIGDNPPVIWSCHVDTVHRQGGTQAIEVDDKHIVRLKPKSIASCLGADDTAGVWLLTEMIKARRPGLYIFHRGEEVGCKGSKWIMDHNKEVAKDKKFVIALDRANRADVITFQRGMRCCSEEFGTSLATALGMEYKNDPTGAYTDSAEYTDVIGECTNLSVGYQGQHSRNESLDVRHLCQLRARLLTLDVNNLVSKRKPGEKESRYPVYDYGGGRHFNAGPRDDDYWNSYYMDNFRGGWWEGGTWKKATMDEWQGWRCRSLLKSLQNSNSVVAIAQKCPLLIALMLEDWGFDARLLKETLCDIVDREFPHYEGRPATESEGSQGSAGAYGEDTH